MPTRKDIICSVDSVTELLRAVNKEGAVFASQQVMFPFGSNSVQLRYNVNDPDITVDSVESLMLATKVGFVDSVVLTPSGSSAFIVAVLEEDGADVDLLAELNL